jgi:hypothetical protein
MLQTGASLLTRIRGQVDASDEGFRSLVVYSAAGPGNSLLYDTNFYQY